MNTDSFIHFDNATFSYPGEESKNVFEHFSADLPGGFTSLIGPNASGKSTFMLLASGRLAPQEGIITLFGENLVAMTEQSRNLIASIIYQNMEFETADKTGDILEQVWAKGHDRNTAKNPSNGLLQEVTATFELSTVLSRPLNVLSKGEMQRTLLAFAVLYGSCSLFVDEPLFAMEAHHKEAALEYLKNYSIAQNVPIYISMHELDLSRKYAENILLFYPNRDIDFGTPQEILVQEALEKSYGVPMSMLKDTESLNRKILLEQEEQAKRKPSESGMANSLL